MRVVVIYVIVASLKKNVPIHYDSLEGLGGLLMKAALRDYS